MDEQVAIKSLSFWTLFRIVFWAGVCVWGLVAAFAVVVAVLAPSAIVVNGVRATTTAEAIGAAPIFLIVGAISALIFAIIGVAVLRLVGRFLPLGAINVVD